MRLQTNWWYIISILGGGVIVVQDWLGACVIYQLKKSFYVRVRTELPFNFAAGRFGDMP